VWRSVRSGDGALRVGREADRPARAVSARARAPSDTRRVSARRRADRRDAHPVQAGRQVEAADHVTPDRSGDDLGGDVPQPADLAQLAGVAPAGVPSRAACGARPRQRAVDLDRHGARQREAQVPADARLAGRPLTDAAVIEGEALDRLAGGGTAAAGILRRGDRDRVRDARARRARARGRLAGEDELPRAAELVGGGQRDRVRARLGVGVAGGGRRAGRRLAVAEVPVVARDGAVGIAGGGHVERRRAVGDAGGERGERRLVRRDRDPGGVLGERTPTFPSSRPFALPALSVAVSIGTRTPESDRLT
jgi:hypothetical protein